MAASRVVCSSDLNSASVRGPEGLYFSSRGKRRVAVVRRGQTGRRRGPPRAGAPLIGWRGRRWGSGPLVGRDRSGVVGAAPRPGITVLRARGRESRHRWFAPSFWGVHLGPPGSGVFPRDIGSTSERRLAVRPRLSGRRRPTGGRLWGHQSWRQRGGGGS